MPITVAIKYIPGKVFSLMTGEARNADDGVFDMSDVAAESGDDEDVPIAGPSDEARNNAPDTTNGQTNGSINGPINDQTNGQTNGQTNRPCNGPTTESDTVRTMTDSYQNCVLCELTGSGNAVVDEVNAYILDNIGKVNVHEMARQVSFAINTIPGKYFSRDMFLEHIRAHMRQQKVVLSGLLHDLLEVAHASKESCVCVCSDTNTRVVDPKMLTAYLKTVDSIMGIYRCEAMKERRE